LDWQQIGRYLAKLALQYPHFVALNIDDFYCMMEVPGDVGWQGAPLLPMSAIAALHAAIKDTNPAFMFLPTIYPTQIPWTVGKVGRLHGKTCLHCKTCLTQSIFMYFPQAHPC
jgi:hypothetical protein